MSSRRKFPVLAGLLATMFLGLAACSPDRDPATLFAPEAVGVLVVDAVLIVDQPLPNLRLTRTQPPDQPYDLDAAGVTDAEVIISSEGLLHDYYHNEPQPGVYTSYSPPTVAPHTRYDLRVTTPAGEVLTASTVTPGRFTIDRWVLLDDEGQTELRELRTFDEFGEWVYNHPDNQLNYAEGLLDARYSGTDASVYGAAGFQLSLFSLDPEAGLVIDPPFFEEDDFASLPRQGSSPVLNGEDGFVRLPWFSIFFDGRHLYKAYAVDLNWFDLERTIPEGGGGFGGNLGEGVDPPLFHVQGGIGLFGSASVDSLGFTITPLE